MKDIFDRLTMEDIFDQISKDVFDKLELKIKTIPRPIVSEPYVKSELKPLTEADIMSLIRGEVLRIPKPKQERVIERIEKQIIKEIPKEDKNKYADEKTIEELKKEIQKIRDTLENTSRAMAYMRGGSGVIGIPQPEGNPEGYVLTVSDTKAKWKPGGGSNSNPMNIGDPETDGSWRIIISGNDLSVQRRESGTFVEKASFNP